MNSNPKKLLFFLLKSAKWATYRDYCYTLYGKKTMTFIFGLFTVMLMPFFFWLIRRCENGIQYMFRVRQLAKLSLNGLSKGESEDHMFFESVLTIRKRSQVTFHPTTFIQKFCLRSRDHYVQLVSVV